MSELPVILIHSRTLAPYHIDKLNALAETLAGRWRVIGLATTEKFRLHMWKHKQNSTFFERCIMFEGAFAEDLNIAEVAIKAHNIFERYQPTIIVANGYTDVVSLIAVAWSKKHGRKCILVSDSTEIDRTRRCTVENIKGHIVGQFDGVLVSGKRAREYINKLAKKQMVIWEGVDVVDNCRIAREAEFARRNRTGLTADCKYILCLARYASEKNLEALVLAHQLVVQRFNSSRVVPKLFLVGEGPLRSQLEEIIRKVRDGSVKLCGYASEPEIWDYLANAEALVLPSLSEPWGLVVNEAMAAGVPVIVSERCGCVSDLVDDGITGIVVDATIESIAEGIGRFIEMNSDQRRIIVENAFERISKWGIEKYLDTLQIILDEIK